MPKKKPVNGKAKGKRGELEWASVCRAHGYVGSRRTAQYCGNTGDASDVIGLPGVHQEVKRAERLNIEVAMVQAVSDANAAGKHEIPIVAHRKNGHPWMVTMFADDWFRFYEEWSENRAWKL